MMTDCLKPRFTENVDYREKSAVVTVTDNLTNRTIVRHVTCDEIEFSTFDAISFAKEVAKRELSGVDECERSDFIYETGQ